MTHEQKPESAEFRTLRTITMTPTEYDQLVKAAEARGAAEQRRKDEEGDPDDVTCALMDSHYVAGAKFGWGRARENDYTGFDAMVAQRTKDRIDAGVTFSKHKKSAAKPVDRRPANVATLEARVKELEGTLRNVRASIEQACPKVLVDTLWMPGQPETVVDYIYAAIREGNDNV